MSLPACASRVEPQAPSHTLPPPRLSALVLHTPKPSKAKNMFFPCSFPPLSHMAAGFVPALGKPPRCLSLCRAHMHTSPCREQQGLRGSGCMEAGAPSEAAGNRTPCCVLMAWLRKSDQSLRLPNVPPKCPWPSAGTR